MKNLLPLLLLMMPALLASCNKKEDIAEGQEFQIIVASQKTMSYDTELYLYHDDKGNMEAIADQRWCEALIYDFEEYEEGYEYVLYVREAYPWVGKPKDGIERDYLYGYFKVLEVISKTEKESESLPE